MQHAIYQKARDERNLTNAEISRAIGMSESYVCKIMRGERPVTERIREQFYRMLGLPEPIDQNGKRSA